MTIAITRAKKRRRRIVVGPEVTTPLVPGLALDLKRVFAAAASAAKRK
jgi:hypothetical protein